ncbi:MAG: hypothetical protein WCR58_11425 [Bacteroidales bacterium]|nr:hypothetical protein [Bacteroidales bacterium]MCK9447703.1 hypothetical protein [Bacteroidales bacterium]MDD3700208.1 hypothetical protein [Bacteroidales bacterium]MDY0370074.1 hypothetical protein [Bacteroidales bacterium]
MRLSWQMKGYGILIYTTITCLPTAHYGLGGVSFSPELIEKYKLYSKPPQLKFRIELLVP